MTTRPTIIDEAEAVVRRLADHLAQVRPRECLCCYVVRRLEDEPCDGTQRHALHFRDVRAPRSTALPQRLGRLGGWCDCEIFLNGYAPRRSVRLPAPPLGEDADPDRPEPFPNCAGVRGGSVQPCANWQRRQRRW